MIVNVRIVVGDEQRRAINAEVGKPGLATRAEVAAYVLKVWESTIACLVSDQADNATQG